MGLYLKSWPKYKGEWYNFNWRKKFNEGVIKNFRNTCIKKPNGSIFPRSLSFSSKFTSICTCKWAKSKQNLTINTLGMSSNYIIPYILFSIKFKFQFMKNANSVTWIRLKSILRVCFTKVFTQPCFALNDNYWQENIPTAKVFLHNTCKN